MRPASWLLGASLATASVRAVVNITTTGSVTADDLLNQAAAALKTSSTSPSSSSTSTSASSSSSSPTVYQVVSKTDPVTIAQDLSVFAELYSDAPPVNVRNLRDNTQNTEAVVQSIKTTSSATSTSTSTSSDPTQAYPSPITVHAPSIETSSAGNATRRRLDDSEDAPLSVLFCDPSGNAIWKWNYFAPVATLNATSNTSSSNSNGVCDARTSVKVSAFQAGCSLQNHPQGCANVLYKGCGGMTVHPETKRVVVARTGGRSLGVLTYKRSADNSTCQGRTVDALTSFKGRKFNSPSDAEFSKTGDLYFTDSPFGLAKSVADFDSDALDTDARREIPFNGVYVLRNNSKAVELVDCTMDRPNQIAFAPTNDVMYITNSRKHNSYVKAFPLLANGTVGTPSVFFNFTAHPELETDAGYANGIKVDADGNVFVVAYNGVFVFSRQAELLLVIRSSQQLSGVSLGADRMFYTGAFGIASQAGVNFSTIQEAHVDC